MSTKYNPVVTQFWTNTLAYPKFNSFVLNTGATVNTVPVQNYINIGSPRSSVGIKHFNPEDKPFLSKAAVFANFADGLPFVFDNVGYADFPGLAIKFDSVGGLLGNAGIPIPALNSWFDLGYQIPTPSDGAVFDLWVGMRSFSFYTKSIDTAYNGEKISFTCAIEVQHTFPLQ